MTVGTCWDCDDHVWGMLGVEGWQHPMKLALKNPRKPTVTTGGVPRYHVLILLEPVGNMSPAKYGSHLVFTPAKSHRWAQPQR